MEKTYVGSCHCGNVRYEVATQLQQLVACNCSICTKTGTLLTFVTAENFTLLSGEESLSNYQFNKKVIDHFFCSNCGIRSFAKGIRPDGKPMVAVNVRCLDGVEIENLDVMRFDGKSL